MKELQLALAQASQFTTVGNGNTVGIIPYCVGGGISSYTPLIGYACENIVSARVVVVEVSSARNTDLLWAIRGAGQVFGLVTEIVMRTYDLSSMGNSGVRQLGMLTYPSSRAMEVCEVLAKVISGSDRPSAGHFMIVQGSSKEHVCNVAPQFFGTRPEFQRAFQPLADLEPDSNMDMPSTFDVHSDHLYSMCLKGDFKRFSQIGLAVLHPENFGSLVKLHKELLETCPGAEKSVFSLEWHTPTPDKGARENPTSFGLKGVDIWLNILTWYTDSGLHDKVQEFERKACEIMRSDIIPEAYVTYTNTSRDEPIENRYKDPGAVNRLKELKRRWDPTGVFNRNFL